jgi:peptidoglycan/LPS O-acetylase OafA/YrhL
VPLICCPCLVAYEGINNAERISPDLALRLIGPERTGDFRLDAACCSRLESGNSSRCAPEAQLVRSTHESQKEDNRVPDLDGIRGIAIWMVLLLHIIYGFTNTPVYALSNSPGALDFVPPIIQLILRHGWLGVNLFFMLSGFLITGILLGSKDRPHYFKNFYIRRVLRIMPLYFACIIVWSILYRGFGSYFLLSLVFGANMSWPLHIAAPHGPGVLWSLAIEEHFYLVWPLIVLLLNKRTLAIVTGVIFLGSPILRLAFAGSVAQVFIYMCTWFQLDGLAAGAMIALWARSAYATKRSSLRIAGVLTGCLVLLTVAGIPFGMQEPFSVGSIAFRNTQAYLGFAAVFVLVVAYRGTKWTAPLRWRFLQLSGVLSYCLYLVHLSVGDGYEYLLDRFNIPVWFYVGPFGAVCVRAVVMIGVSFAIALLSRKYLEQPFLSLKDRFTEAGPLEPRVQATVALSASAEGQST